MKIIFGVIVVLSVLLRLMSPRWNTQLNSFFLLEETPDKSPAEKESANSSGTNPEAPDRFAFSTMFDITSERYPLFAGMIFLVCGFCLIEFQDPYYFAQDDALVTELPGVVYMCRGLFAGQLPEYNPYNLLGSIGWSSGGGGTYPPVWVAYGISRFVLNDEFATFEVLALMHMIIGYVLTYWLAYRIGMRSPIPMVVALSYIFCGSLLITGRAWHAFHALSMFLPMLSLGIHELFYGKFGYKWIIVQGIAVGLLYHAGFPQAWMLTMILIGFASLWGLVLQQVSWQKYLRLFPMLMIGAGIMFPLYLQQRELTKDLEMISGYGGDINFGLKAIFLPYPLIETFLPNGWGSTYCEYGGHFFYYGSVLAICSLIGLWFVLTSVYGPRLRQVWVSQVWTICGFIALLFCLGDEGKLWILIRQLPAGLSNHPFRCFTMYVFFACLSGGIVLQAFIRKNRSVSPFAWGIATCCLLLVGYHLLHVRAAFYNYGFRPYPDLAELLKTKLIDEAPTGTRMVTFAPDRSIDPFYPYALPHSLPCIYGVTALHGYDPLSENKKPMRDARARIDQNPVLGLSEYGVRWATFHERGVKNPATVDNPLLSPMAKRTLIQFRMIPFELVPSMYLKYLQAELQSKPLQGLPIKESQNVVQLIDLGAAKPLCWHQSQPETGIPLKYRYDGFDIDIRDRKEPTTGSLTLNFLLYPHHRVWIDGVEKKVGQDNWGRITVELPENAKLIQLRYAPDWFTGFLIGGVLVIGGLGWGAVYLPGRNKPAATEAVAEPQLKS
jgi:hypothetical protein